MFKVGIVDTTFARVDMGSVALEELRRLLPCLLYTSDAADE